MANEQINNSVEINHDNAVLLLAAAQELDLPPGVVATTSDGYFTVPQEVVDKAGLGGKSSPSKAKVEKAEEAVTGQSTEQRRLSDLDGLGDGSDQPESRDETAKKTAAKRAPAKKAAAKKAAAPADSKE